MIPLRLELTNVRTFDTLTVDFPAGVLAITGSNGAGKSTLIDSIDVALFGRRSLAPWLSDTRPEGQMTILLVFEHGGDTYRVRRTFSGKGRGTAKLDLEHELADVGLVPGHGDREDDEVPIRVWEPLTRESTTETQAELERIIGFTRDTFRVSSFLAQRATGFCEAPARDRKRHLAEMLSLGEWDVWHDRARADRRAVEVAIAGVQATIAQADQELAERPRIEQERAEALGSTETTKAALDTAIARAATARDALADARARVERRAGAQKAVQQADRDLFDLRARISTGEDRILRLDEALSKRERLAEMVALLPELEAEAETLTKALNDWTERQRLVAEQDRLMRENDTLADQARALRQRATAAVEGVGHERCDRCQQVLGEEAAHHAHASLLSEVAALDERANHIEEHELPQISAQIVALPTAKPDLARLKKLPTMIQARRGARELLAGLDEQQKQRDALAGDLDKMRAELPERESVVAAARADLEALGPHDPDEADRLSRDVAHAQNEETRARELLEATQRIIGRHDAALERLDQVDADIQAKRSAIAGQQADLDVLMHLERACGPNGVPALILENVAIPQIETEASRLLAMLGGPAHAIELRTLREKKTGGIAEALDVILLTEHGERDYTTFSGGEKARIDFALRMAFAQLLAGQRGADTGLLVIDEIGGLDARGIAALTDVLRDLEQRIRTIVVVSHQAELRDAFDQSLELVNENGRSRVADAPAEALVG